MPPSVGTRSKQTFRQEHIGALSETRTHQQDIGMTKRVVASCTFVDSGTEQIQAANGTFANFAVGDDILVEGTNLNNGAFHVNAIDGTNHSYLTLDQGVKNEGPLSCTVRAL